MTYVNKPRPYKHEYETYQGKPDQIKKRAERNADHERDDQHGIQRPSAGVVHIQGHQHQTGQRHDRVKHMATR